MLSSVVCKKCWLSNHRGLMRWSGADEQLFKEGFGVCPSTIAKIPKREYKTNQPPPRWCPRKFEHAVAARLEEKP
jgi:hypothetical protein